MHNMETPAPPACFPTVQSWGAAGRSPKAISAGQTILQPQLTGQVTQTLTHLVAIPAHLFYQGLSGIERILRLDSLLQMWFPKHLIERDNPFPPSTGHAFIDPSQAAASSFYCQGTLLAHAQLTVCQHPRAFSTELLSSQFLSFIYPLLQTVKS